MAEYAVTLPVPPSANKYWMVANNRIIVTPEGRGGSVPTWKYYQPRIRSLLADVMALGRDGVSPAVWTWVMSAPEEVKR